MLEQRIVVDGGSRYLFIGPAVKDRHYDLFDAAPEAGLSAEVITYAVRDF
jgi:hypothetical protein